MTRPVLSRFSNIKIGTRVHALAALSVVTAVALVAVYLFGDRLIARDVSRQLEFAQLSELSQRLRTGTLQMRRREKDFLLRKDMDYARLYAEEVAKVEQSVREIGALPAAASVAPQLRRLDAGIKRLNSEFVTMADLYTDLGLAEDEGVQGHLRDAVHAVEETINEAGLDALTVKMLMMRRHEKDFMLRGDAKYIGRIDQRRAEFDTLLQASDLPSEVKEELGRQMDVYQAGVREYAGTSQKLQAAIETLSTTFAELAPDFDAVFEEAEAGRLRAEASLQETRNWTGQMFVYSAIADFLIAFVFGIIIGRSITRPLRGLTAAMQKLAGGETAVAVPNTGSSNELGDMARAVEVFKANAVRNKELVEEQEHQQEQTRVQKAEMMRNLAEAFNQTVGQIVASVSTASGELNGMAGQVSGSSEETNRQASSAATAAERVAANVQTVASATEEMSASVSEINQQVERASSVSSRAASSVGRTAEQMQALSKITDRIGEVVSMISDIAAQTNLLALNATIESARAGEVGKGFAVVAGEVKQLAGQTSSATESITKLIEEIQSGTNAVVGGIDEIGSVIDELEELSSAIASAMEEQGATTQEVARNISEAATATQAVSGSIVTVSEVSQETNASSHRVRSSAEDLSVQSARLSEEVARFLETIRAA